MTELLDARQARQEILKGIIRDLHAGKDFDGLKARFANLIKNVSATEIAEMENQLMAEGMPPEEVKRLCDVHAALFKEGLAQPAGEEQQPGHPLHTFRRENKAVIRVVQSLKELLAQMGPDGKLGDFRQALQAETALLEEVNKHYLRKENQLFPVLERLGVYGPPKVMWQVHDDIRGLLKGFKEAVDGIDVRAAARVGEKLTAAVAEMVDKEENILFPMCLEKLSEADWGRVRAGEEEIGYALVQPGAEWRPPASGERAAAGGAAGMLELSTGELSAAQVDLILTHLPLDLTFADENGVVRYYSQGQHRIFPRSPGIIGRQVQNCHPAGSLHVVNKIIAEFKDGSKDVAEFWLEAGGRFIHIRFYALRDKDGAFRGVLEATQDVTEIRGLEGERRLLDW